MMIFEENTKSLFTSDLFIQLRDNKPVISEDLQNQ
jgi:flavorubredoxin